MMLTPPSLCAEELATSLALASIPAWSSAVRLSAPPTVMLPLVLVSIQAWAVLLTMLLASTPLPAAPAALITPCAAEVASLPTVALSCASEMARSVRSPPALIVEFLIVAVTVAACSVPMSVPTRASRVR